MNKSRLYTLSLIALIALGLLLAACSSGPPPPAEATVNGVTSIDRVNGSAQFSVSGLDAEGEVVTSGTISNVSATVNQPGFGVDPGVCGNIVSKGPITATITLDASGSMAANDPTRLRGVAAKAFIDRMLADHRAAVTSFEGNNLYLWQEMTADKVLLKAAVDKATYVGGGTPLWNASAGVINYLSEQSGDNKVALVFTDGENTACCTTPEDVIAAAQQAEVRVFMLGLGTPSSIDTTEMTNVAGQTGGVYAAVESVDDVDDDDNGLEILFTNIFNASVAAGCVGAAFDPIPSPGQTMTGTLSFTIDGAPFTGGYEVTF